ncbi:hypothetical protein TWF694_001793 [Orbilia ellipsospora]|uniref:Up-regulated during septation protein 1 domain-containing protein n=1 Tax=Orbilia ellipsospora TaxID=2528407 RepID=A0AAV9X4T0_9PEZI
MALTLFPPRAPSRQGPQAPDLHNVYTATTSYDQRTMHEERSKGSTASPIFNNSSSFLNLNDSSDNRVSILPPLPTFASRSESRAGSPGPLRSASNSRQNSPTRAAQNLTPPPTMSLPPLPVEVSVHTKNGRPMSPNTKTQAINKGSYLAGAKMKAKETFMRRKGSMPEIQTGAQLIEEQELPMDSPTIPGRPPAHDRQASVPVAAFSAPPFGGDAMFKGSEKKEHKRSASAVRDVDRPKVLLHKGSDTTIKLGDVPKPVHPPKLSHAATMPIVTRLPNTTPNQTVPSPPKDLPPTVPPKDPAPLNVGRPGAHRLRGASESTVEKVPRHTALHKRHASERDLQKTKAVSTHTSAKRRSTSTKTMPRGMRPVDIVKTLQPPVIASLQSAARKTCEKFAVLSPAEVDTLTAELASLEERCEYLRKTHQSLRSGKKALHMKMLQHLRSDRSGSFSRETLLKQQEALADLDSSIDDWEAKMERAETRRAQVHRKLLEHVAAALSVNTGPENTRTDTPPSTPENRQSIDERTQSIKVYALLADVEHEYGRMFTEPKPI